MPVTVHAAAVQNNTRSEKKSPQEQGHGTVIAMQDRFDSIDTNQDGMVDRSELNAALHDDDDDDEEDADAIYKDSNWFELHASSKSERKLLFTLGLMFVLDFVIAIIIGLHLNQEACGNHFTCDISDRIDAKRIKENGLGDGKINFLNAPSKTAAVAVTLYAITILVRTRCHPRVYGMSQCTPACYAYHAVLTLSLHQVSIPS